MVKSTLLQSEFARRFNRINSGSSRYISPPEVDSFLNEAIQAIFENRAPLYKTSSLAREELRVLEEKNKCFECQEYDDRSVYFKIPEKFYKLLRVEASIKCDDCPEIRARTQELKNHEIYDALNDVNWEPSYSYSETYFEISKDIIIVYHKGKFDVTKVCIDYLRRPTLIATPSMAYGGSYINGSGELISVDVNLELPEYRKIVDLAVLIASRDITDLEEYESQYKKIVSLETVYIN
jgi:hypothetical protein